MSEGSWSANGSRVGVSRVARCHSQCFGAQWESQIGLSENNLHRFGVGVEVQTLKMALFFEEKKRRGQEGIMVVRRTSPQEQRALFAGCALRKTQIWSHLPELLILLLSPEPPSLPAPRPGRAQKDSFRVHLGFVD